MGSPTDRPEHRSGGLRTLPCVAAALFASAWMLVSCGPEEKRYVPNAGTGEETPTMATADVTTLISDSGYTRYKVTTPLWLMFEDAEEPFWRFPDGLELEQYDTEMQPESNVICDSAIYYSRKRLWRLDGNVVMVNTLRDSFLTQQLFWDQTSRKIYSDSFIHIVRSDRTIEGYGFESDQSMVEYTVNNPTAILPADRRPGANRDAQRSDSTVADTSSRTRPAERASMPRPEPPPHSSKARPGIGGDPAKAIATDKQTTQKDLPVSPAKLTPAK